MKLFFREYGEGPPIIIVHGLLGSGDNWLTQAKLLSPSYKVYTVDQRNHGLSPHSDTFDYESMVSDLAEFIDDHKIIDPVLMGHSMGGKTVMNFSIKHPDKLKKLIVVDISPRPYGVEHYTLVEGLMKLPLPALSSRNDADAALAGDIPDGDVRQFLLKNLQRKPEGGFSWKLNLAVIYEKLGNVGVDLIQAGTFDKPTLFVRGSSSGYVPDEDWDTIVRIFPNAKLETMDTGHWIQAEKPKEFVEVVMSWMRGS